MFPQKSKSEQPKGDVVKVADVVKTADSVETNLTNVNNDPTFQKDGEEIARDKTALKQLSSVKKEEKPDIKGDDDDKASKVTGIQILAKDNSDVAELMVSDVDKPSQQIPLENKSISLSGSAFQELTVESIETSDMCLDNKTGLEDVTQCVTKNEPEILHQNLINSKDESSGLEQSHSDTVNADDKALVFEPSEEDTNLNKNQNVEMQKGIEETKSDSEDVTVQKVDLIRNLSSGDFSSSAEFVNDKDIPVTESIVTPEEESCVSQACNSDPELIDFDKEKEDIEVEPLPSNLDKSDLNTEPANESNANLELMEDYSTNEKDLSDKVESDYLAKAESKISGTSEPYNEDSLLIVQQDSIGPDTTKSLCSSDSESSMNKLDSSLDTCASGDTVVEQFTNIFNKEDNEKSNSIPDQGVFTELTVDVDCESHVMETNSNDTETNVVSLPSDDCKPNVDSEEGDLERSNISPAHSFVKCMLEDVTEEGKHADDNSDSHSSIEKSEGSRSVYSNQESGDEVDTTTSSDIEIISLPTPNGENRQVNVSFILVKVL